MKLSDDRKQILGRIRKALLIPAHRPGAHGDNPAQGDTPTLGRELKQASQQLSADSTPLLAGGVGEEVKSAPTAFENQLPIVSHDGRPAPGFQQWLPPVGETWDERAALFALNAADLKAEFYVCENEADMTARLTALSTECGWARLATHHDELTKKAAGALGLPILYTDNSYPVADLEACDVGITACEALIAQTGSVLVTNRSAGGRALSVLPPHHVVLARRDQMVPDLTAAFALLRERYADDYPTMMSFITGPSRTGDIERILVLGAHGPKRLTIFCV